MKPVVWGILGVSTHYRLRVSAGLSRSTELVVRGIASRDRDRAARAAEEFGLERSYGSYEELLDDPEIEAVYNPLPNHMHVEWIRHAADAGKHVLCEKPLALNADETAAAFAYAGEKGVLLMEAFMYRFHPQWLHARELVSIGEVGTPTAVHCNFFYNNQDPDNIRNQLEAGGGALMDIGCYAVSSSRFLLGAEPKRVVALIDRDERFGTDRLSSGILDFGGVRTVFTVGTQTASSQEVQLFGTGGSLRVELPFNAYPDVPMAVHVTNGIGRRTIPAGPADQYRLQFESFSRAIREGRTAPIGADDAVANQKVLDALFRSAEKGGWEEV
ncbi:MAG: Gfo/Idh/MocA family protein [Alkalispirochaeta sp.]